METHILILLWSILGTCAYNVRNGTKQRFKEDFLFGVATSAYQIEGSWNTDGKGWSMWDFLVRNYPDAVIDKSNGDVAANSYELYKRDVEMLTELGVNTYRFSISWCRILPNGRAEYVNPLGVAYYNKLIDTLLENGVTPFVTMYHWDLPQNLNEQGGWLNEDIVDWFGDYARVLFEHFGDRVKYWLTINEPNIHCKLGYGNGKHAPRIRSPGKGFYDCGRNILLANARAYHIYREEFKNIQDGKIGLVFNMDWPEPDTDTIDNLDAIASYIAFNLGQYADPIFTKEGDYPQLLVDRVAKASFNQGYNVSRLRSLTREEVNYIKGTSDFFALNHYSNAFVYRNDSLHGMFEVPSVDDDAYYVDYGKPSKFKPCCMELSEYAPGFYKTLHYIKEKYNNPIIYVTENGQNSEQGLYDYDRIRYLRSYISAMLGAINDGVNVKGYFAWNLMDDFEWNNGYTKKYGLYEIDMNDPARTRTPRRSAFVYKEIIRSRTVDFNYDPDGSDFNNL